MRNYIVLVLTAALLVWAMMGIATAASESYVFDLKWGDFDWPYSIAIDSAGNVYVADTWNNRIQKFNATGSFITKWGSEGSANGQFYIPEGVAVDNEGNVYVADSFNNRIQKFDSTGSFITKWGSYGTEDGQFEQPYGVDVDSAGNVYVTDAQNHRVQKFNATGSFITKWGSYGTEDGQFNHPYVISVDNVGNVYVADTDNHRIQKFNATGSFITKWGEGRGSADGQFYHPFGVGVDNEGNVYVADSYNHRIQKFNATGSFITKWGGYGPGDGQFHLPYDIAIDTEGNVYVADTWNNRIQKFRFNPLLCINGTKIINCEGADLAGWVIRLKDSAGVELTNTTTDANGDYQFCNLVPGSYTVCEDVMTGYDNVTPTCVAVTLECENVWDIDFTNEPLLCIYGTKIINCEGADLAGWVIRLKDSAGVELTNTTTDANGDYQFCNLVPGSYTVCEDVMTGYDNVTPTCVAVTLECENVWDIDFTNEPSYALRVTLPNGGETWTQGSLQTIRWEYHGDPGPTVNINVMKGSKVLGTIPAVPAGSGGAGSYNLTLPYKAPLGSDFRVRVTSTSNATFTDTSNNPFTIGPAITVVSPNGGENYLQGSTQTINWTFTDNPGPTVKIEALQGETVLAVISPATPIGSGGQGSFNLTFPYSTPLGSEYRIRITSTAYPGCTDTSNAPFSVVPNTSALITLVSPDGGENYLQGSKQTITWTYNGYPGPTVKIEALRGETVLAVITPATAIGSAGSGSFNLTFPYNTPLGSDYRIRVSSTIYPTWTDTSENPFTISPAITVISPNGGSYSIGSIFPMGWTYAGNPGATVNIDVIKGASTLKTLTGVPIGSGGSGWYNVTIPASTPPGADYQIRVSSTAYPACTDTSDLTFTIG